MTAKRQILVTNALPYANGSIHMGHLLGYIQADIWVRAMRSMGHDVIYVCADDAHGTAIMLRAKDNNITPEELIQSVQIEHKRDFDRFGVSFDYYDSTHSDTNYQYSKEIYLANHKAGNIVIKPVTQLFDPKKQMFLSDRFIKGTCPACKADDQYGDSCEVCGKTYNATELINPRSTLSDSTPIKKTSDHYFFKLPNFTKFLQKWTRDEGRLPASIANKLDEWFKAGLTDWDISRDAPYFGFKIPNTDDKYFYVWVDAPIGYMASFKNYLTTHRPNLSFDDYWNPNSTTEVYHFIGKDIVYFHALFWPAMLSGANYRTPTALFVNGFLTVNGEKMSKSRGTFIKAETYLKHLNPEYLRYYFASKLSDKVEDSDLNLDDFITKVNADLVGKVVNIASRCAKFINTQFANKLSDTCAEPKLVNQFIHAGEHIIKHYEKREFSSAIREIMALADLANQYIDDKKPWAIAKENPNSQEVQDICSVGLNLFHKIMVYLSPVLPTLAEQSRSFLNVETMNFDERFNVLTHSINEFKPLLQRIDPKKVQAMVDNSKENLQPTDTKKAQKSKKESKPVETTDQNTFININDFAKVEMKVAKVLECNHVKGADKLLQFTLDVGDVDDKGEKQTRNVFSGIAKFYQPEELQGKTVICVTNLAPRKMKFGISEGMILSAEKDGQLTVVLLPDSMVAGATLA
ncbi:methionine--tRNA ligase [Moraxella nonliquefaciens]|uniref:Methionine--tRNA ligase n=1 Tax=Moraxella nonliquefaciens TaxID=478 RepID=A0A1B8QSE8_MORNO|nr:methionine--tRNA ligase [Moraxella nonliquefaciens]OBX87215.1 methionine--tRNA ligase [Moraxella nonliquefaciens]QPT44157.1 methionine--tRNA ligase [Moraxella nonliquefaciens]QQC29176.1 methionine--tRNA ligase [Moraxella nonliquefaciens]